MFKNSLMDQSIPAADVPLACDPRDLHIRFAKPPGLSLKIFIPGGRGLDQVKFFKKLTKICSVFLFLVNVFKRLLK